MTPQFGVRAFVLRSWWILECLARILVNQSTQQKIDK